MLTLYKHAVVPAYEFSLYRYRFHNMFYLYDGIPSTHWGRVTHICVGNLTIIGPDNGLSPGRRQAIIWTNAGILLIGPWGTNCNEILIGIQTFSFKKMHLKMSSAKWRPFCLGLNVLSCLTGNMAFMLKCEDDDSPCIKSLGNKTIIKSRERYMMKRMGQLIFLTL